MLQSINKILIIRPCAIGDFVQTLPAIRSLRNRFPHAYIEISGNLSNIVFAKNQFYANNINSFDRQDISFLFLKEPEFPQSLIDYIRSFDLVLSYLNDDDHVLCANIRKIGVDNVVSYDPLPIINRCNSQSTSLHESNNKKHIIDHILEPVISLGINGNDLVKDPKIYVSEGEKVFASDFFNSIGSGNNNNEKIVAMHPGSGSKKKNWSTQGFCEVAEYLIKNFSIRLLIVSGPADETVISTLFKSLDMRSISVLKDVPLLSLAAILERVDCFFGNDSGISHVAAAVGVPSALIFGPTDPNVWAPREDNVKVIRAVCSCSPCQADKMRKCESQRCLEGVSVGEVIEQIQIKCTKVPKVS